MGSKRDGLADVLEPTLRDTSPQARHHFTQADQVNQLVGASDPIGTAPHNPDLARPIDVRPQKRL